MSLYDIFERNGVVFTFADPFPRPPGKPCVFEILQMGKDNFAGIEALRAPGAPCEFLKAFFDGLWEAEDQRGVPRYRAIANERPELFYASASSTTTGW